MTDLVVLLSTGKGTWTEVIRLLNGAEWSKIFIVTDDFGKSTFNKKDNMEFIIINSNESIELLIDNLQKQFKDRISGTEVALNMISGSGKEHMALLSSLLKMGLGIRLIVYSNNAVKEI